MLELAEFINNEELSTIIINAIPEKYKKKVNGSLQ
jgi:hypothetical protein